MKKIFIILFAVLSVNQSTSANEILNQLPQIFQTCSDCHGEDKQKGGVDFRELTPGKLSHEDMEIISKSIELIEQGEMPPSKKKTLTSEEKSLLINELKSFGQKYAVSNETVFRRINRSEYINSVADLFGFDPANYDFHKFFPDDQRYEGIDKIGSELRTSTFLYEKYISAADIIVENFLKFSEQPKLKKMSFSYKDFETRTHGPNYAVIAKSIQKLRLNGGTIIPKGFTAPEDGIYKFTISANALNQRHNIPKKFFSNDQDEPIRMSIVTGKMTDLQFKATFDMDENIKPYECDIWLNKGQTPWIIYSNSQMDFYNNDKSFTDLKIVQDMMKKLGIPDRRAINKATYLSEVFRILPIPQIRVYEASMKGPFYKEFNPYSNHLILKGKRLTEENWQSLLLEFASKAYRKAQTLDDISELIHTVNTDLQTGKSLNEAFKAALKTVLCSPNFLYLQEKNPKLDSHEIAARLSYFLWSSPPDKQLISKAEAGLLVNKNEILNQAKRMLKDKKSDNFIHDFSSSWLQLYDLEGTSPDRKKFRDYYAYFITNSSMIETQLYFNHIFTSNKSIYQFLDSDYTFLDRSLSRFYGYKPVSNYKDAVYIPEGNSKAKSTAFVKYKLPDNKRGGLMGHSSILTVSANGVDTSPIIRGAWIQEKMMNNPPPEPPEVVTDIGPDTQGAKSLKERIRKHTETESCASCHKKFDPIGFALENFDATGKWRQKYKFHAIDSSGVYNGKSFNNISDLKSLLVEEKEIFARGFIKKITMYAIGRKLSFVDEPALQKIIQETSPTDYQLKDIILKICSSDLFTHK